MTLPITIDYTAAYEQGGGIGRYVRELVAALARIDGETPYKLFVAGATRANLPAPMGKNFTWQPTRLTPKWLARIWHRAQLPIPVEWWCGESEIFHATDFVLPPTKSSTYTLLTVHDLSFVRVPEAASPRLKAYLDAVVPRSVQRANHVLADSMATKEDLIELYGTSPDKITVLLSGIDTRFKPVHDEKVLSTIRQKYNIPQRPYLFTIGTVQPRKNYSRLVLALKLLHERGYDIDLVIAGGKGWLDNPIYTTIRESGLEQHIHMVGFVDDEDLPALYSAAELVAFPSLYEGFGFPVLEGMACGTPVLTSNVSSLPEVAGDAAIMVDPYNVEAIADGLIKILGDNKLRDELIAKGFEQAKRFTWEKAATHLKSIYTTKP